MLGARTSTLRGGVGNGNTIPPIFDSILSLDSQAFSPQKKADTDLERGMKPSGCLRIWPFKIIQRIENTQVPSARVTAWCIMPQGPWRAQGPLTRWCAGLWCILGLHLTVAISRVPGLEWMHSCRWHCFPQVPAGHCPVHGMMTSTAITLCAAGVCPPFPVMSCNLSNVLHGKCYLHEEKETQRE